MATLQEIIEEAERLFPQNMEQQRQYVSQKLPEVGMQEAPSVQEILGTQPQSVEDVKSRLAPTIENAKFIERLEKAENFKDLLPTTPVVKPRPAPGQPKDEDIEFLNNVVNMFGTKAPTRIEGYSDDQLEGLIDLGSPNAEEAREELQQRREGGAGYKTERLAGQNVAGAAEVATSGPVALAGLLAKGAEFLTGANLQADDLLRLSEEIRQDIRKSIGISEPRDIGESLANIAGSMITIPGVGPSSKLGNLIEVTTPLVVGSGNKRVAANFIFSALAEQGVRELADTAETPYRSLFDIAGLTGEDDTNYPEALKGLTIGLGLFAGASIIGSTVAHAIRNNPLPRRDFGEPVRILDPTGPEGLRSIERAGDVYKTYLVDEKEVLSTLAERAGVYNLGEVKQLIDQDTQMSALMRINESMRTGRLRTKTGSWEVDVTPNQLLQDYRRLPLPMQDDVDMFLKYRDTTDVLQGKIDMLTKKLDADDIADDMFMKLSSELDEAQDSLYKARQAVSVIEQRTPIAQEFAARYRHIIDATRGFLASGDSSMLSSKSLQNLQKSRPNFVPSDLVYVDPTGGIMQRITDATQPITQKNLDRWYRGFSEAELDVTKRVNSFEILADYTRSALKSKMENDVRSAYTRAMKNSIWGRETLRLATRKDVEKWPDRVVEVWENGQKVKYLSSRLQADLLRFDPYVAKYPSMFLAKRLFEHGTTGPLSITFAPITAIRDSLAGWVLKEPGTDVAGPLGVALSIPKQVWAKMQLATVDLLQNNLVKMPFLDDAGRLELAKQVSNSYMNSFYHMANEVGGFDASLMKHNIQVSRGVLRELAKSADATAAVVPGLRTMGHSFAAMARGFAHLFDAVAEAPRFAAFQKNVKAGMDASDAAITARRLTGDTTRSGRVYTSTGRRITGDVSNRALLAPAGIVGTGVEFIRETTPYFNPMIQGMRKLTNAMIDDPVGTNLRAWMGVGLPALAAIAWNEMLGEDYNRYSFERRNSRDIAMNLYLGIPGKPPQEGLQIPIAHELMMFNSPWTTALYAMMKGEDGEEVNKMIMHMGQTALENSAMIGFPQVATTGAAIAGVKAPESLADPWNWADDIYQVREDNAGMLPSNTELMLRAMFGGIADTVIMGATAFYDGGPEAFFDELGNSLAKKLPIAKNLTGNVTSVSNFTPLSEERFNKIKSLYTFLDAYDEHIMKPEMLRVSNPSSSKGLIDDEADEFTRQRLAPIGSPKPTNPVFLEYGDMIKDTLDRNSEGVTGLKSRYSLLTDQIRSLKNYTAGRKDEFRKWQRLIDGSDIKYQEAMRELSTRRESLTKREYQQELKALQPLEEKAKADRLVKELKLDLKKRSDVQTLIDHLETQKIELMKEHIKLIELIEDKVTEDMLGRGMIQPGQKFTIEDMQPW